MDEHGRYKVEMPDAQPSNDDDSSLLPDSKSSNYLITLRTQTPDELADELPVHKEMIHEDDHLEPESYFLFPELVKLGEREANFKYRPGNVKVQMFSTCTQTKKSWLKDLFLWEWIEKMNVIIQDIKPVEQRTESKSTVEKKKQETSPKNNERRKLLPEEPIKSLWANEDFRGEFCKTLNLNFNIIHTKNWRYLGKEFGLDRDDIDKFGRCDLVSPSETMFQKLEEKKPDLKIKYLCEALKNAEAYDVFRIVQSTIKAKKIDNSTLVVDMWDDAAEELEQIILNLDQSGLWRDVARSLGFRKKDCDSFDRNMNPALNRTLDLFDILRTQCPKLKVQDLKEKLEGIEQEKILKIFKEFDILDNLLVSKLSENADVMVEIEHVLNNPKDRSLWRLAQSFKKDGVVIDMKLFQNRGIDANPTYHLMEHVIARFPEEQTIENLIIKLIKIERNDCLDIIEEYLEGGVKIIEIICQKIKEF